MAKKRNFFLGHGERLTAPVVMPPRRVSRHLPYTFEEARSYVLPMLRTAVAQLDDLPARACPDDNTVAALTLHPEYIAKSYFPGTLLRSVQMRAVGSQADMITPRKRSRGREPIEAITTRLFVAGARKALQDWLRQLPNWSLEDRGAIELAAVERFAAIAPADKVKPIEGLDDEVPLEVVLHASKSRRDAYIVEGFEAFLGDLGIAPDLRGRMYVGGLCFLALPVPRDRVEEIARFSFLRVVREVPRLRVPMAMARAAQHQVASAPLPKSPPLSPDIRVAVFDGGLPERTPLRTWVHETDAPEIGRSLPLYQSHGHAVTCALLFGSLEPGSPPSAPFSNVHHFRVVDAESSKDRFELYDVLQRIKAILAGSPLEFINLSLGPDVPIDDNEVHVWTSTLDAYLSKGNTLASIAVGNNGDNPNTILGYDRIQIPSDCVNALAVGAAHLSGTKWRRAPYSAIGPGRSPGMVKPDVLAFGGCNKQPFFVLSPQGDALVATHGTSFAAPAALRMGICLRAYFGDVLTPLAIKALLIHSADTNKQPRRYVGWGRIAESVEEIAECDDDTVRVIYQGEIDPSKYIRASIPMPNEPLAGKVSIAATFCFTSEVDAAYPSSYTRSGLEIFFRPHEDVRSNQDSMHAKTARFFRPADLYATEDQLRRDAHKWETCLHAKVRKRASGLKNPAFDIHYHARADGRNSSASKKMRYALVVTVNAPHTKDLYDRVVRRYRTILEPLTPIVQLPVRVGR